MGSLHSASGITANRKLNKTDRRAIGEENAPAVVGKPEHGGLGKCYRGPHHSPKSIFNASPSPVACQPRPASERVRDAVASAPLPAFLADAAPVTAWQKPVGLLPAVTPVRYPEWRQIRRQLALMCGPRPRCIPSGEVIALGPGGKPSPYQPDLIARTQREVEQAELHLVDLRTKLQPGTEWWRGASNASWEIRSAEQRVQAAKVLLYFVSRAA